MTVYDVAIVGYGPVGAVLANLLGCSGFKVLVLEQALEPYDKPRAIGLDHEAIRVLQSVGLADEFMANTRVYPGGVYLGVDGDPIRRLDPYPPPYPLAWPPNVTFVQPELERILRRGTGRFPNVDVRLPCRLTDLECSDTSVSIEAEDLATQTQNSFEARYLFACDGAGSPVRTKLGIPIEDQAFDEWWVVVDMLVREATALPATSTQYCWPSRPATYVFGPGNLRRWELKLLPHETPEEFQDPRRVLDVMRPYVDTSGLDLWRSAVYRFHALVAAQWRSGRVFLVGDAAHQTPPFLGQGLCAGIRDAANLAWKVALVERHGASPALLDTYMQERKPHVTELIRKAKEIGLEIGELDREAALRRDVRLREELRRLKGVNVRQRLIPNLAGGVISRDCVAGAAGSLFVQPRVRDEAGIECLLDDALGSGFVLATNGVAPQDWLDAETRGVFRRLGGTRVAVVPDRAVCDAAGVKVVHEIGTVFSDWMNQLGAQAVLVRPDRYVYGAADSPPSLKRLVRSAACQVFSVKEEALQ